MKQKNRARASLSQETFVIFMVVCCGIVATLSFAIFDNPDPESSVQSNDRINSPALPTDQTTQVIVSPNTVPLSTGDEPIDQLFVQSGCAVCHTIPGIEAAQGREGPRLELSLNGPQRLADPSYQGSATTVREYVMESILNPAAYVVPGYPDRVMPRWYGKKLNAKALDRIASYLEAPPNSLTNDHEQK